MKVGIYVDAANISLSGGYSMRYDVLRDYCLGEDDGTRLNTYLVFDVERARNDPAYKNKQQNYFSIIRNFGYKVITKNVKRFYTDEGDEVVKASVDFDMAVDMLVQGPRLDKIFVLTGDGDFRRVVRAMQNFGARVEVIGFKNVSRHLMHESDGFTSGFIIPNLLPMEEQPMEDWGRLGSRVRGVCYEIQYKYNFGFFRYIDLEGDYNSAFFHFSELPEGYPPKHEGIYEFELDENEKGILAKDIQFIC